MSEPEELHGPLEGALRRAVKAATWLQDSDVGAVELASMYAQRMDQGAREFRLGDLDSMNYNKVLYLGPHLLNTLKALGLAPEDRMRIMLSTEPAKESDIVDDLKHRRRKRVAGEG